MSLSATKSAWAAALPASEKLVLVCLADHANGVGKCWPSVARLGERCGLHRASIMRAIAALERRGHIEIERGVGQQNRYVVHPVADLTSRMVRRVRGQNQAHYATGTTAQPVAVSDMTSRTVQHDQSLCATPPVAQCDPNLLRTYQEPTKNLQSPRRRPKVSSQKTPALHQEIIDAYHEVCPTLPTLKIWTDQRRKTLEARIAERKAAGKAADTVDYWRGFFEQVAASPFLSGHASNFRADLPWLLKPENFAKTIEGRYDGARSANGARAHG